MSAVPSDTELLDMIIVNNLTIRAPAPDEFSSADDEFWSLYRGGKKIIFASDLRQALVMTYVKTRPKT